MAFQGDGAKDYRLTSRNGLERGLFVYLNQGKGGEYFTSASGHDYLTGPVPEPGTVGLLMAGGLALVACGLRRSKQG